MSAQHLAWLDKYAAPAARDPAFGPAARADSPECNDEKFVAVNPFIYKTPFGEVLSHAYELFEVGDAGLLHDTGPRDMHPRVSSRVPNGYLQDPKRLL